MNRFSLFFASLLVLLFLDPVAVMGQLTDQEKIASAMSAAPPEMAVQSTILDWPAGPDEDFRVLREGNGPWTCLPDNPATPNEIDQMCVDQEWMNWIGAFVGGTEPPTEGLGLSYMLNTVWAVSNDEPGHTGPTADNSWVSGRSHLMIIVPDPALLEAFPTDPATGGAYVMWKGTPYAHLMVPVPDPAK